MRSGSIASGKVGCYDSTNSSQCDNINYDYDKCAFCTQVTTSNPFKKMHKRRYCYTQTKTYQR